MMTTREKTASLLLLALALLSLALALCLLGVERRVRQLERLLSPPPAQVHFRNEYPPARPLIEEGWSA